jgi:hypothetical protein
MKKYSYLKTESKKTNWEKFKDGCKKVGEWCKDYWKATTIVLIIAAIVIICVFTS